MWGGTGGHDDHVGIVLTNKGAVHALLGHYLDVVAFHFALQVGHGAAELRTSGEPVSSRT